MKIVEVRCLSNDGQPHPEGELPCGWSAYTEFEPGYDNLQSWTDALTELEKQGKAHIAQTTHVIGPKGAAIYHTISFPKVMS
jgi:hypothetical protein